jgi:transcriptional regulator with XRE-family HTH domain
MNDRQIFGAYLKAKRNDREIPIRLMAERVGIKPGYFNDIESGRRTPIELDLLDRIVEALHLSDEDRQTFFDLAGKAREAAPPDLTGYINTTAKARVALRVAKEMATDDDWERFIQDLKRRREDHD